MSIRVAVLGAPRCFVEDRELEEFPAQRNRFALLVYLAIERDMGRDDIAAVFWPDNTDERPQSVLIT
jgi:DNA-binding SARP family transcriptional activator